MEVLRSHPFITSGVTQHRPGDVSHTARTDSALVDEWDDMVQLGVSSSAVRMGARTKTRR